jgi:hypothetical protein
MLEDDQLRQQEEQQQQLAGPARTATAGRGPAGRDPDSAPA